LILLGLTDLMVLTRLTVLAVLTILSFLLFCIATLKPLIPFKDLSEALLSFILLLMYLVLAKNVRERLNVNV
jgi:hypothetical protein